VRRTRSFRSYFIARILDENKARPFLDDFVAFQKTVNHYGLLNGLAQTLLRLTAPGAPDTYQGTELWDLSLVDPDNRRPVDYGRRREMLAPLKKGARSGDRREAVRELLRTRNDGRVKLYVTHVALVRRRENPGLFSDGAYAPLAMEGAKNDHAFGFVRGKDGRRAAVIVPRLLTKLVAPGRDPVGDVWEDTLVRLPGTEGVRRWRNLFTGAMISPADRSSLRLTDVFAEFPVALLEGETGERPA